MKEGRDVVRVFDRSSLQWTTLPGVKLSEYRWYPTQVRPAGPGSRAAAGSRGRRRAPIRLCPLLLPLVMACGPAGASCISLTDAPSTLSHRRRLSPTTKNQRPARWRFPTTASSWSAGSWTTRGAPPASPRRRSTCSTTRASRESPSHACCVIGHASNVHVCRAADPPLQLNVRSLECMGSFLPRWEPPDTALAAPSAPACPFHPHLPSITLRKSRYDLGKSFFTNITPGYQLYPTVLLLPWTDSSAPGDYFLLMYTCRTGQVVRFTSRGDFLPMWNMPGLIPQVSHRVLTLDQQRLVYSLYN
jgi:hypothetical protein